MMNNYDIMITPAYLNSCTFPEKCGMFPTFEIINAYTEQSSVNDIIPTTETSPIMDNLSEYFGYNSIVSYYKNNYRYRNVMLPISRQYPSLNAIAFRLRTMWALHDVTNKQKFLRLIDTITNAANISPLYNKHKKWTSEDVTTPNTTEATTGTNTRDNDTTLTQTLNISDAKTGTEQKQKNGTEAHSGQDVITSNSTTTTANETVNGVTAYDTTNFANNDNSVLNGNETVTAQEGTTYGENITNTGTDTTTYNTTRRNTGTDTKVTDGTETETLNTRKTKTGTETQESTGDEYESDISLAEAQRRESAMTSILTMYFESVMHDLSLYTLEDIW